MTDKDTLIKQKSDFNIWLYQVCEIIATKTRRELTEIYSSIDLTDAKLQFIDGISPEEFKR